MSKIEKNVFRIDSLGVSSSLFFFAYKRESLITWEGSRLSYDCGRRREKTLSVLTDRPDLAGILGIAIEEC